MGILQTIKKSKNKRKTVVTFLSGVLIMYIIFIPFMLQPQLSYLESEMLYSEDAIVYNQAYNEIFDELGNAGADSLFIMKTFNVSYGDGIGLEIIYNDNAVQVERLGVFEIVEDGIYLVTTSRELITNPYTQIIVIDGTGVYGIALFCTRIGTVEPILISINVMVVTV